LKIKELKNKWIPVSLGASTTGITPEDIAVLERHIDAHSKGVAVLLSTVSAINGLLEHQGHVTVHGFQVNRESGLDQGKARIENGHGPTFLLLIVVWNCQSKLR